MPRYYRRYWRGRDWAAYHVSQRRQLSELFAGIDKDIENIFLNLSYVSLDGLFSVYGRIYGKNAGNYARETFPKWKNGATKLSGQTAERLLNLIPPYLPHNTRYELIKKLREHYLPRHSRQLTTIMYQWKQDVLPIITELVDSSSAFRLPRILSEKAAWLSDGDVDAANRILASLEQEEARIRASYLEVEFKRIQSLVDHIDNAGSVRHTIKLPQGEIYVIIEREKPSMIQSIFGGRTMKKTSTELVPKEELQAALVKQQQRGNLLNLALDDLTEQEKQQLKEQVIKERLRLDVSQADADQRFENSTRDMANTIRAVSSLEQSSKGDYEVKSSFETASGRTDIHVKKRTNIMIIVVAIVIGIIILMLIL